ncbi:thymidylate synthase/dCMP hydroxymethylase domain-containing protein [Lentinula edodes]|uniref:thymidylate synthase n=1 Tax=Lentinula lateritia TaxID=40482 RepID=A0A9W9A125_9AGAR|nr:thymidylate synthase/dCMP hydroxymethylase domain-containing protein [Lentinula edodes]
MNTSVSPPNGRANQYLSLIRHVLDTGDVRPDRTGTGTIALFAPQNLRFSLSDSNLPLLTTKRTFLRGIIEELLWFVHSCTDSTILSQKGVKIWDGNGSKAFLEGRGLGHRREGIWVLHFGAEYKDCDGDYTGQGVDQLRECIQKIKENPTDRRIIMSAWNPKDIPLMALPPCHLLCQFYVHLPPPNSSQKPKLSCLMYQRSADLGLGIPFNIASYALLTHMIARVTGTDAHELIIQLGDAHVYRDHVDALKIQLTREPRTFPKLKWAREEINDIEDFVYDDFIMSV